MIIAVKSYILNQNSLFEAKMDIEGLLLITEAPPNEIYAEPPKRCTKDLRKYLGKWAAVAQGSFYFFKQPEPRIAGYAPGVMMSSVQIVNTNATTLYEEATLLQEKMKRLLHYYGQLMVKITLNTMFQQTPRYQYLYNETRIEEEMIDALDQDWIFAFSRGAMEAETAMSAYRILLKKFNYVIKKIICLREGKAHLKQGRENFLMVFVETELVESDNINMIRWSLENGFGPCQYVEAPPSLIKYKFYDEIIASRKKVAAIMSLTSSNLSKV